MDSGDYESGLKNVSLITCSRLEPARSFTDLDGRHEHSEAVTELCVCNHLTLGQQEVEIARQVSTKSSITNPHES